MIVYLSLGSAATLVTNSTTSIFLGNDFVDNIATSLTIFGGVNPTYTTVSPRAEGVLLSHRRRRRESGFCLRYSSDVLLYSVLSRGVLAYAQFHKKGGKSGEIWEVTRRARKPGQWSKGGNRGQPACFFDIPRDLPLWPSAKSPNLSTGASLDLIGRRPTLPHTRACSTIGAEGPFLKHSRLGPHPFHRHQPGPPDLSIAGETGDSPRVSLTFLEIFLSGRAQKAPIFRLGLLLI